MKKTRTRETASRTREREAQRSVLDVGNLPERSGGQEQSRCNLSVSGANS